MKIKEYNQMMRYLTSTGEFAKNRKNEVKPKEKPFYMTNIVTGGLDNVNAPIPKRDINDYINQVSHMYEDNVELSEKNKKINAAEIKKAKGGIIKDPTYTTYSNGGTAKNKKNIKKENVKLAMSETPKEEAEMMLSGEAIEFMKWLKKNPNKTYNDWLKDKTAFLTEEQKKDKKIIDLTPFLPSFEEELERMEREREKEKEKETLEDFILRRSKEMRLAEADSSGLSRLLAMKR